MQRIIFVNLHGNEFLLKTLNKFIFKQSVAIKHKYLIDYLLSRSDIQVCTYINTRGFSMASSFSEPVMKFLNIFRFLEYRIVLYKNHIPYKSIKVIRKPQEIKEDDIVIAYRHGGSELYKLDELKAYKVISMVHFWGKKDESKLLESISPDILINESDLTKYSEIFKRYYGWYSGKMIVHPFVFAPRFVRKKAFVERENKAFATGTITYKQDPDFLEVYGDPCDQPTRKQIKDHIDDLKDLIYCTSSDFSEGVKSASMKRNNSIAHFYNALHYKLFESQQKSYYSFDMVETFNKYKMCVVGEEILGVPGIGFVEGMACGCAYIGQTIGYYEDYGMKAGVHYIGYDGTLEDLKAKIKYFQKPENQIELETIANNGYEFVHSHFSGNIVAKALLNKILSERNKVGNNKYK